MALSSIAIVGPGSDGARLSVAWTNLCKLMLSSTARRLTDVTAKSPKDRNRCRRVAFTFPLVLYTTELLVEVFMYHCLAWRARRLQRPLTLHADCRATRQHHGRGDQVGMVPGQYSTPLRSNPRPPSSPSQTPCSHTMADCIYDSMTRNTREMPHKNVRHLLKIYPAHNPNPQVDTEILSISPYRPVQIKLCIFEQSALGQISPVFPQMHVDHSRACSVGARTGKHGLTLSEPGKLRQDRPEVEVVDMRHHAEGAVTGHIDGFLVIVLAELTAGASKRVRYCSSARVEGLYGVGLVEEAGCYVVEELAREPEKPGLRL